MSASYSPLARFVLFVVCLSVAGAFVAGVHHFAVDLSEQQIVQAPTNGIFDSACVNTCNDGCQKSYNTCPPTRSQGTCQLYYEQCTDRCSKQCACSDCKDSCGTRYYACLNQPGYTEGDCAGIAATCRASCPC